MHTVHRVTGQSGASMIPEQSIIASSISREQSCASDSQETQVHVWGSQHTDATNPRISRDGCAPDIGLKKLCPGATPSWDEMWFLACAGTLRTSTPTCRLALRLRGTGCM